MRPYIFLLTASLLATSRSQSQNTVGKLPALGWNSWNAYNCQINETDILTAAQQIVDLKLKNVGYQYVNIDDCWSVKDHRDATTQRLIPDPVTFPNGIKSLADKVHNLGLKIGIYSSAGTKTCAGYPASLGMETIDATTWAEWGIDYLKYDNCYVPSNWTDDCNACVPDDSTNLVNGTCTNTTGLCPEGYNYTTSKTFRRYEIMGKALAATGRPILYSLCEWGQAGVQTWGASVAQSWRSTGDITPSFPRILEILNENSFYLDHVDFYAHSDPDMLEIGNGLSPEQSRTHFAFWAAMKSPLIIGTDLSTIDSTSLSILKNTYLLAFSQDSKIGTPAKPFKWGTNPDWTFNASFPAEYWSGAASNGTLVLLLNPYEGVKTKNLTWAEVPELRGKAGGWKATDIWTGEVYGCSSGVSVELAGYDTAGYWVSDSC